MTLVDFYIYSCWFNAALSGSMMALTLLSRPMNRAKLLWSLTCLGGCLWCLGMIWVVSSTERFTALWGAKFAYMGSILTPVFYLHTVLTILEDQKKTLLSISYLGAGGLLILHLMGKLVGVHPQMGLNFYIQVGPFYFLYLFFFTAVITITGAILIAAARRSPPLQKRQYLILLAGGACGFLGAFATIPLKYGIQIFPYGNFIIPFFFFLVAFGMFQYHLMDFKTALKKLTLVIFIYMVLLILSLPLTIPIFKRLTGQNPDAVNLILIVSLLLALIISGGPLLYALFIRKSFWLREHVSSGLTHELKSPIASIQGAAEMLSDQAQAGKGTPAQSYLDIIQRNAARLEKSVQELLRLAQIQGESVTLEKVPIDPRRLVEPVLAVFRPQWEKKGLRLETDIATSEPVPVDIEKMRIVFSNLLENAIKFSTRGTIRVALKSNHHQLTFSVSDEGKGIAPQHLNRIFERFYQGEKSGHGSGLGLAIAKGLVEAHGGHIWAESQGEGKGTTVTFALPAS